MSLSLTQFTRSLKVYVSAYDIPSPYVLTQGQQDGFPILVTGLGYRLVSSSANFRTKGIAVGDIVYVYNFGTINSTTVVSAIEDDGVIYTYDLVDTGYTFTIYQQSEQSGLGNQGCFLMATANNVTVDVETITGTFINGVALNSNEVLPVQIKKIFSTTNNDAMYALW